MNPPSVRPLLDVDDDEHYARMFVGEGFDPTPAEVERWVAAEPEREEEDENPEEATRPKLTKVPRQPTQEEVDEHMATHLPFRDWCPHCVRGKSRSKPHKKSEGVHEIPTLVMDYMVMHSNQEEREEKGMPILVTKDLTNCANGTGMVSASVVFQKGACPQAM